METLVRKIKLLRKIDLWILTHLQMFLGVYFSLSTSPSLSFSLHTIIVSKYEVVNTSCGRLPIRYYGPAYSENSLSLSSLTGARSEALLIMRASPAYLETPKEKSYWTMTVVGLTEECVASIHRFGVRSGDPSAPYNYKRVHPVG